MDESMADLMEYFTMTAPPSGTLQDWSYGQQMPQSENVIDQRGEFRTPLVPRLPDSPAEYLGMQQRASDAFFESLGDRSKTPMEGRVPSTISAQAGFNDIPKGRPIPRAFEYGQRAPEEAMRQQLMEQFPNDPPWLRDIYMNEQMATRMGY